VGHVVELAQLEVYHAASRREVAPLVRHHDLLAPSLGVIVVVGEELALVVLLNVTNPEVKPHEVGPVAVDDLLRLRPPPVEERFARPLELRPVPRDIVERLVHVASSPTTSRIAPIIDAFHALAELSHIKNQSWCSATGQAKRAPEAAKSSAVNMGMKSLYPNSSGGPYAFTWCSCCGVPGRYMLYGYHFPFNPHAGTE